MDYIGQPRIVYSEDENNFITIDLDADFNDMHVSEVVCTPQPPNTVTIADQKSHDPTFAVSDMTGDHHALSNPVDDRTRPHVFGFCSEDGTKKQTEIAEPAEEEDVSDPDNNETFDESHPLFNLLFGSSSDTADPGSERFNVELARLKREGGKEVMAFIAAGEEVERRRASYEIPRECFRDIAELKNRAGDYRDMSQ